MFFIKLKMCVSKQDLKEIITQMSVSWDREMTAGWIRACPRGRGYCLRHIASSHFGKLP